jgi:hypothetical protein
MVSDEECSAKVLPSSFDSALSTQHSALSKVKAHHKFTNGTKISPSLRFSFL